MSIRRIRSVDSPVGQVCNLSQSVSARQVTNLSYRRGYTLVELLIASMVSTVLMAGMASSIYISSQAYRHDDGTAGEKVRATSVMSQLDRDLSQAITFSELTDYAATFTVPDRDGDQQPDTIRYFWSGTAGHPLTYSYNGSTPAATIAADVKLFKLTGVTRDLVAPVIGPSEGGSRLLLVVINAGSPTSQESAHKTLIESWGYTVTMIAASDSQANFDAAVAENDVAYITEEITASDLGTKLKNAAIGVVNEEANLVDEFGFAQTIEWPPWPDDVDIIDNSHYITEVFPAGQLVISNSDQPLAQISGTLSTDLQTLAEVQGGSGDKPGLAVLEAGDALYGGGNAAGRRVEVPWAGNSLDINELNGDGRTLMQRSIAWAAGAGGPPGGKLLFVVTNAASPTSQETTRKTLLESWGHTVTLIGQGASQSEFDTAAAANDVVYVSQEITTQAVGTKIRDFTIGIVNEEYLLTDELGFTAGYGSGFFSSMDVLDNSHYITSVFLSGGLALFTPSYDIYTGGGYALAPGGQVLGQCGSITAMMAVETGATLHDSGTAAGRRVLVPWGDDFAALNTDGQTLMRRAIEWAAGAGDEPLPKLLLVVTDTASPTSQELLRIAQIESWGYTVTLIDDGDSQSNFDAAAAAADVAYVSEEVNASSVNTKLRDAEIGVVNEDKDLFDDFGFANGAGNSKSGTDIDIQNNTHEITSPFGTGDLTIVNTNQSLLQTTGNVDDMTVLAELSNGSGATAATLGTFDVGQPLNGGGNAAGRRVMVPWGDSSFDFNSLNADGLTIMRRSIDWAAGGADAPQGIVFEGFTEAKLDTNLQDLTIDKPSGTSQGDLLIAAVATDKKGENLSAPGGWSPIFVQIDNEVTLGVWWKLAGASEPANYEFSWTKSEEAYGWIMRFTGHDPADPIDTWSSAGGSGSSPTSTPVNSTVDNAMILRLGAFDDDDITIDDPGITGNTPITMDKSDTGSGTVSGGAAYVIQPTAGNSGTENFSLTGSEEYRTVTVSIAPDPSP